MRHPGGYCTSSCRSNIVRTGSRHFGCVCESVCFVIIDRVALAKQGDNVLGSVRLSVRLSVCAWICRVQQRAKKGHYQSEEFVCVLNNRADAVDQLLIDQLTPLTYLSI